MFDGVRIPYAITGDALRYYRDVTLAFRAGDFSRFNNLAMQESSLDYLAQIERHELYKAEGREFPNATVVTMKLDWSQNCGTECALHLQKQRVVVFDDSGTVIAVFHDGPEGYRVA